MFKLIKFLLVVFIFSLTSISAKADGYIIEYGKVGKWTIFGNKEKGPDCVADTDNANVTLRIAYFDDVGEWGVFQPYYGKQVTSDGYVVIINGQIAFDNGPEWVVKFSANGDGWALYSPPNSEVFEKRIRSGSKLELIMDRGWQTFSLEQSSAALDMVIACVNNEGRKPAERIVKKKKRKQAPRSSNLGKQVRDCDTPISGKFKCNVISLAPEAGYQAVFRVEPMFKFNGNELSYFVRVISDNESDVWYSANNEPWTFLGEWVSDGPNTVCIWPGENQTPEVNGELGQDAWELCIR